MPRLLKQHLIDIANGFDRWNLWKGGGGGSSTLASLSDVLIINPQHGDTLKYSNVLGKWTNQELTKYFIIENALYMFSSDASITNNSLIINDALASASEGSLILNG